MRKATAGILAAGSALALTAAAATAISVTGPFDPAAGTDAATTCDIGDTSVDTLTDGASVLGFKVTTGRDTSSDAGCIGADIWIRVDYTLGNSTTQSLYATLDATVDHTSGVSLYLNDGGTHNPGNWFAFADLATDVATLPLADETTLATSVLVFDAIPGNFGPTVVTPMDVCFDSTIPGQEDGRLVGPVNTVNNWETRSTYNGSCGGSPYATGTLIAAPNLASANHYCAAIGGTEESLVAPWQTLGGYPAMPNNFWFCDGPW